MKKVIKSRIFLVIMTTIIVASISVYAATIYNATDIVYNASNGTSMTVNDALNELYNKSGDKGYYYSYKDGTAIYYNPVSGEVCTDYVESNSLNENKTGCMKWYLFNDDSESSTVNMILDHNTTVKIIWNASNKNVAYEESNLKAEVDKLVSESGWVDTPRIISAEELNKIGENTTWTSTGSGYHLDNNSATVTSNASLKSRYAWLYDYTNTCTNYGCNIKDSSTYGYWTSTTYGTASSGTKVWIVHRTGSLGNTNVTNPIQDHGIRPVITIPKSRLS